MTKEDVYDSQINPLMAKVLEICKEHKIAMLASFSLIENEEESLECTSALLADEYEPPKKFLSALELLYPKQQFTAFTITTEPR